jgi:hypothetical protein
LTLVCTIGINYQSVFVLEIIFIQFRAWVKGNLKPTKKTLPKGDPKPSHKIRKREPRTNKKVMKTSTTSNKQRKHGQRETSKHQRKREKKETSNQQWKHAKREPPKHQQQT